MGNLYEKLSYKRKQLQADDLAPEWMSTASYQLLFNQNYLNTAETPKDMYHRIAARAAELTPFAIPTYFGYDSWYDAFFSVMWNGWLSPSTPVLTNMGNNRGHPIACSGTYLGDSIRSFYQARMEIAQLTQRGYGTSWGLDPVRARGSAVSKGGTANGIMQPAAGVVQDMKDVSQNSRRGSVGQYLDVMHPDFDELVDQLIADHDGWNIGWNMTDEYKELFNRDPQEADRIWKRILKARLTPGKGYMHFVDKVNRARPQMYKDRGFYVRHSNLCVTGDTKILTKDFGYVPIATLEGQTVECWNGQEWSMTPLFKTSEGQEVLDVEMSNGHSIRATPYHRWVVARQDSRGKLVGEDIKTTGELLPGDKLIKFNLEPVTHGTKALPLAYESGFYTADGCLASRPMIYLYHNKQLLLPRFNGYASMSEQSEQKRKILYYANGTLLDKYTIPSNEYSIESRLEWLAGLFDGDGTLTNNNGSESIQLVSTNKGFITALQLMLQEIGVHSLVRPMSDAGYRLMPANDGTGQLKQFWCAEAYRILIAGSALSDLLKLGYSANRVMPTVRVQNREARNFVKVISITDNGECLPTYCGTEPKLNRLMFNGVLTMNCQEIALMSDEEHSFTCVLSSTNVARYDEWKDTHLIQIATVFLDAVVSDMLIKAKQEPGFERIIAFTEKSRALGLGVLGEATYYQQKSWVFGDLNSIMFNQQLLREMDRESLTASRLLAKELGEPEWLVGYGIRNSHRLALPPTKSTAVIMGGVSDGIMPVFANVYEQDTAGGLVYRINPVLLPIMKGRGQYNEVVMARIAQAQGSVQGEDWLSPHEKDVFKTAFELNQETVLLMASHRQKIMNDGGGGQGQSINLYFPMEATEEEISRIHNIAFEDEYIQGLYYVHSLNEPSTYKVDRSVCASCEG
jgi:ribonucleoside-diphosphate reductase alpha chain